MGNLKCNYASAMVASNELWHGFWPRPDGSHVCHWKVEETSYELHLVKLLLAQRVVKRHRENSQDV